MALAKIVRIAYIYYRNNQRLIYIRYITNNPKNKKALRSRQWTKCVRKTGRVHFNVSFGGTQC